MTTTNPLHESIREAVAVLRNILKTGSEDGRIRAAKELIATSPEYGTLREVLGDAQPAKPAAATDPLDWRHIASNWEASCNATMAVLDDVGVALSDAGAPSVVNLRTLTMRERVEWLRDDRDRWRVGLPYPRVPYSTYNIGKWVNPQVAENPPPRPSMSSEYQYVHDHLTKLGVPATKDLPSGAIQTIPLLERLDWVVTARKNAEAAGVMQASCTAMAVEKTLKQQTEVRRLTRKLAKARHARDMARHDLRAAVKFAASIGEARDDAMAGNGRLAKEADALRERVSKLSGALIAQTACNSGLEIRLADVSTILTDAVQQPGSSQADTLRQLVAERDSLKSDAAAYRGMVELLGRIKAAFGLPDYTADERVVARAGEPRVDVQRIKKALFDAAQADVRCSVEDCVEGMAASFRRYRSANEEAHGTLDFAKVPRTSQPSEGPGASTLTLAGRIAWLVDHGAGGAT